MKWLILLCVLVAAYHAWSPELNRPVLPCHKKRRQYAYRQYGTQSNELLPKVATNQGDSLDIQRSLGSHISGLHSDRNIVWQESRSGGADYTGKYAELASPVPSHVNLDELVESLRAASNHP